MAAAAAINIIWRRGKGYGAGGMAGYRHRPAGAGTTPASAARPAAEG